MVGIFSHREDSRPVYFIQYIKVFVASLHTHQPRIHLCNLSSAPVQRIITNARALLLTAFRMLMIMAMIMMIMLKKENSARLNAI